MAVARRRITLATFAAAGFAAALGGYGCTKHDDTSTATSTSPVPVAGGALTTERSAAQASPASAPTLAASASATVAPTPDAAEQADLAKLGVPIYPNAKTVARVSDVPSGATHTMLASFSTTDSFEAVDTWYRAHLPQAYQQTQTAVGETRSDTYQLGDPSDLPYDKIVVQFSGDPAQGPVGTHISMVLERRTAQ
jgi:hypothetical protein